MGDSRQPQKNIDDDGLDETAMNTTTGEASSTTEKKFRKNTLEELRKKRLRRKKKKNEVYKMTKKERVAIFKKKAIEPYLQQLNESEAKYRHERRISAYLME